MATCTLVLTRATVLVFAYLCAGELAPVPAARACKLLLADWAKQQVLLLAVLSCMAVLVASAGGWRCVRAAETDGGQTSARPLLKMLNISPVVATVLTTCWFAGSGNCPLALDTGGFRACDYPAVVLDAIGLVSAKLARLNLGIALLLAARGESSLILGAAGLGYPEAMPLHREAGWWCAGQSMLHSACYLLFYSRVGGLHTLWVNVFPARLQDNTLNRLGLVNGLGMLAAVCLLALILPGVPWARQRYYHVFQRLHLPVAALFVLCCALHDLPILLFALPGIACWYLEQGARFLDTRTCNGSRHRLRAEARVLGGTSGPWVELNIHCGLGLPVNSTWPQWVTVRILQLGIESHPLSVASVVHTTNATRLDLLITSSAGDWSHALSTICQKTDALDVEVAGPYPESNFDWCLGCREAPALLVVAGGTGVAGWLPTIVRTEEDIDRE